MCHVCLNVKYYFCYSSVISYTYSYCVSIVDGIWNDWGDWGQCSVTCGGGEKVRTRVCDGPFFGGAPCPGSDTDTEICGTADCPSKVCFTSFLTNY